MIKRIKTLISVKNLTASQFADKIGVQRSNISHILSERNKPSLDFILKIIEHFPTVSIEWLMNGKGEMFNIEDKGTKSLPSQMAIDVNEPDLMNEIETIKTPPKDYTEDIDKESSNLFNRPTANEEIEERVKENLPSSVENNPKGIEQIMILYKDGSFKAYTPQK